MTADIADTYNLPTCITAFFLTIKETVGKRDFNRFF